jgi:HK97 family phage portal protein
MAIVSSYGAVTAVSPATGGTLYSTSSLSWPGAAQTYAAMWRTQPNVRTCIDFLARNVAQLGIHVFRRVSDTDRVRLYDHPLAVTLGHPNPSITRYRLIETLMQDLGVFMNAYWLKVRVPAPQRIGLVRLPPEEVSIRGVLAATGYVWTPTGGSPIDLAPDRLVAFGGYDPCGGLQGVSPLETLRRILAEDAASAEYRETFWTHAAQLGGVIERPVTAPPWNREQRDTFRTSWQDRYTGISNAGATPILEDGMTWKAAGATFEDAEYITTRKLNREEVAAAYHIPLPMVGILDHATFANIKEQHKQLYQDSLGPWLTMIETEIERQLLPEFTDTARVYVEFNIGEKLQGDFTETAQSLRQLVGTPIMTQNEGRARLNLPAIADPSADQLSTPLNMGNPGGNPGATATGDQPAPADPSTADTAIAAEDRAARIDTFAWTTTVRAFWSRQRDRVQKDPPDRRAAAFEWIRWNASLAHAIASLGESVGLAEPWALTAAASINRATHALLAGKHPAFGTDRPVPRPETLQ